MSVGKKRLLKAILAGVVLYVAGSAAGAYFVTGPWRWGRIQLGVEWTPGSVTTDDGLEIVTYQLGKPGLPLVVVGHGYHGSAARLDSLGRSLHEAGFQVLLFDFRGHGQSEGTRVTAGAQEYRDIEAVLGAVREQRGSFDQVAYLGISMGAAAVTRSPSARQLAGCALLGCYARLEDTLRRRFDVYLHFDPTPLDALFRVLSEWRVGESIASVCPIDELENWRESPLLLVHGKVDRRVPPDIAAEFANRVGPNVQTMTWNTDHAGLGQPNPKQLTQVIEFLSGTIRRRSTITPTSPR